LFCGRAAKLQFYAATKICFYVAKPHVRHSRNKNMYTKMRFDPTLINRAHFLLRLCRNYFCTCGFAAEKHIFAALPQNKDRRKMYLDTSLIDLTWPDRSDDFLLFLSFRPTFLGNFFRIRAKKWVYFDSLS
jgi:hypothetical protein